MQTVIETITPAKAVEYRETSRGNRPMSKTTIRSYADTMKKGKWLLNGVPIIFDDEGHIIDGHHRVEAIILAGIPVQMAVCRGVPAQAFVTIDQGRGRHLGQLLAMQQVTHYNAVASIVHGVKNLVLYGRFYTNQNAMNHRKFTNADFYDEFVRDAEGYQEAANYARELYSKARILKLSWIGSLYYYLSHTGGYDKEYVETFFNAVCSLETSGIEAADMLRNYIIRSERINGEGGKNRNQLRVDYLFAIVCKSWNNYVEGKHVKCLKYDTVREDYPRLILNSNAQLNLTEN